MIQCRLLAAIVVTAVLCNGAASQEPDLRARLAEALTAEDRSAIDAVVADFVAALGDDAGVPEVDDVYLPLPDDATWLTESEIQSAFQPYITRINADRWWRIGLDPTETPHALREPASVISGCVRAHQIGLDKDGEALRLAEEAGDFLIWAQEQAGVGVFPFPAVRGRTDIAAFRAAEAFLSRAEQQGRLDEVMHNGWIVNDAGDGGLQFDNGEAGVALFELYESTGSTRYRDAALRAADWAMKQPLAVNWNYNSFSVYLLATAHRITRDPKYRDAAITKARIGVIPGQLTEGPNTGRWADPHNARPAYHYIMIRSLAALIQIMNSDHPSYSEITDALQRALIARNSEVMERGVFNKDACVDALFLVTQVFADDEAFLTDTETTVAFDALGRFVSEEFRRGKLPLAPREWAMILESAQSR